MLLFFYFMFSSLLRVIDAWMIVPNESPAVDAKAIDGICSKPSNDVRPNNDSVNMLPAVNL